MTKVYVNGDLLQDNATVYIEYAFEPYNPKPLGAPFEWQPLVIDKLTVEIEWQSGIKINLKQGVDEE